MLNFFEASLAYQYFFSAVKLKAFVGFCNVVHIDKIALVTPEKSAVIKLGFDVAEFCVKCVLASVFAVYYAF